MLCLPNEILVKIFGFLKIKIFKGVCYSFFFSKCFKHILKYRLVCRRMQLVIDSEENRYTRFIGIMRNVDKLDMRGVSFLINYCRKRRSDKQFILLYKN